VFAGEAAKLRRGKCLTRILLYRAFPAGDLVPASPVDVFLQIRKGNVIVGWSAGGKRKDLQKLNLFSKGSFPEPMIDGT
jgi:hypothetical protein